MYLKKNIAELMYRINHIQLRERIGILCCLLLLPVLSWDLFVRQSQDRAIIALEEKAQKVRLNTKLIAVEKNRIEAQLANPKTDKWLNEYHDIKEKILIFKEKYRHYHQKTVNEKKLILMLNDMFTDIQPLKMIDFVSMSIDEKTQKKNRQRRQNPSIQSGLAKKYYQLHLQGDYFAILSYLDRIERFPWQIYWDELYYHVDDYPTANVELTFHAMTKETAV